MRAATIPVVCLAFAISTVAHAQERATRSVDDYLCAFAGKCQPGGTEAEPPQSKEAPETKGFRLVRPSSASSPAVPDTKGFRLVRGGSTPANATGSAHHGTAVTHAAQPIAAAHHKMPATARAHGTLSAERRADLRLSFENGSAQLTARAREEAKIFAQSLLRPELADKRFVIEGHTDSLGGRLYNVDLSQRRAAAVAEYLSSLGVERRRLATKGLGFDRPLPGRPASAPENRRVEALLIS